MKRLISLLVVFALLPLATIHAQTFLTGTFSAAQENPGGTSEATGTAAVALTPEGVRFIVSVEGLSGDIAAAHFHNASAGVNGGVVRTITGDFDGGTATGLWTASDTEPLTDALIRDLLAGNLYLNVHTAANPSGEIRAQLRPTSGAGLTATLTAEEETDDVTSDASGTASVQFTDAGVLYFLTVTGLSGDIAAAHFHNAPAGVNGGVVKTITGDFDGHTAFGLWTTADAEPLTDARIADLLLGGLYLNVHTASNPAGEIRGQVIPTGGWGFSVALDADQETHDVTSDATGTAALTFTEAGLAFHVTVTGLSGDIAAAHFHNAPAGENGGVVRTITGDFDGNTAAGVWRPSDTEPLTTALMQELLAGNLYLNVHTAANPGGEIRGQALLDGGASMAATLTAAQEVGDVMSDATGTAALEVTNEGIRYRLTVHGLSGEVAAAHFHDAPAGVNGGVVKTITGDFAGNTASGLWTSADTEPLTDELLAALLTGGLYLNVHTAANPSGEIRGQVYLSGGTTLRAMLTNEQEVGEVTQDATGTAALTLTDAGLVYHLTVDGLTADLSAAHFHAASVGVNGGVVRGIGGDFDGNTAAGVWRASDAEALTDALRMAALSGGLYLNVHTAANPSGEIRGQVFTSGGLGAAVHLSPEQEVSVITSDAAGTASLTLAEAGLLYHLTAEGLTGDLTMAHFHNAPLGVNGGVVRTITGDFDGNTASGLWTDADAEPLTAALMQELLAGNLYLNVHTAANPGGEIRGQVKPGEVVITAVEPVDGEVPEAFHLAQNHPNPFTSATTIAFAVPQNGPVVLRVYNALGQEVATLVDDVFPAGQYRATFPADDLAGGVYFYRLETGTAHLTRSMLLLK